MYPPLPHNVYACRYSSTPDQHKPLHNSASNTYACSRHTILFLDQTKLHVFLECYWLNPIAASPAHTDNVVNPRNTKNQNIILGNLTCPFETYKQFISLECFLLHFKNKSQKSLLQMLRNKTRYMIRQKNKSTTNKQKTHLKQHNCIKMLPVFSSQNKHMMFWFFIFVTQQWRRRHLYILYFLYLTVKSPFKQKKKKKTLQQTHTMNIKQILCSLLVKFFPTSIET